MQKNQPTNFVEECRHEFRKIWVGIIVYEENLFIPQIGMLVTSVGFPLVKDLAVVHWIHVDTFWNVMGQEHSSRVPKDGH